MLNVLKNYMFSNTETVSMATVGDSPRRQVGSYMGVFFFIYCSIFKMSGRVPMVLWN